MNTTLFLIVPTEFAIAMFCLRNGGKVAIFPSDAKNHRCHVNLEAAAFEARTIVSTSSFANMAVIHVEYPTTLHEQLAYAGDIRRLEDTGSSATRWLLSASGAEILNQSDEVRCLIDVYSGLET